MRLSALIALSAQLVLLGGCAATSYNAVSMLKPLPPPPGQPVAGSDFATQLLLILKAGGEFSIKVPRAPAAHQASAATDPGTLEALGTEWAARGNLTLSEHYLAEAKRLRALEER